MIYTLNGVSKRFNTRDGAVCALAGLDLNIGAGERVALIGRSGVGKSTLFRLLNATLRPTQGALSFDGREVCGMNARELREMRRRVGTIYQQHHLVPSLSALDNALCGRLGRLSFLQTLRGVFRPAREDVERAIDALEQVGLADKSGARADELSGGQQQRLAIARALVQNPDVILADEPVASLDPTLSESITNLLLKLADDGNRTLLVSLHAVELARKYFPRVVAMRSGAVAFDVRADVLNKAMLEEVFTEEQTQTEKEKRPDAYTWGKLHCVR